MDPKAHGTCPAPVQEKLRFGCDRSEADRICCFNRHYAEYGGYAFSHQVTWLEELVAEQKKNESTAASDPVTTYFDSVTGKPLFKAPVGRTLQEFIKES